MFLCEKRCFQTQKLSKLERKGHFIVLLSKLYTFPAGTLDVYSYATVTSDTLPSSEPEEIYKVNKSYLPQVCLIQHGYFIILLRMSLVTRKPVFSVLNSIDTSHLGPVVSLTTSFRGQLMPTKLSNSLLFLLEKCENLLQCKIFSHFFQQKIAVYF